MNNGHEFQPDPGRLPRYAYKDYEKWEGDWELIRGIPNAMSPAPAGQHQEFGSRFITAFSNAPAATENNGNGKVVYESNWVVSKDTVVRPDVRIVCKEIKGNLVINPPSLILEILSPSTI